MGANGTMAARETERLFHAREDDMESGDWTCPECGREYRVTKHHLPARDKDSLECDCGCRIIEWNGGVYYTAKLTRGPADTKSN